MNNVSGEFLNKFVVSNLNSILIYFKNIEKHEEDVKLMF